LPPGFATDCARKVRGAHAVQSGLTYPRAKPLRRIRTRPEPASRRLFFFLAVGRGDPRGSQPIPPARPATNTPLGPIHLSATTLIFCIQNFFIVVVIMYHSNSST
jgi:hypothetical protein